MMSNTEEEKTTVDAMEVEETTKKVEEIEIDDDDEEDITDLVDLFDTSEETPKAADRIPILSKLLMDVDKKRYGPKATLLKERSVYALTRSYCETKQYHEVVDLLTGSICKDFFSNVTKAKCAKVVRQVLDIVCSLAPSQLDMQEQICNNIITWTQKEKRTFLRQRVEAKLSSVLFEQNKFGLALDLINRLLLELKKLDDKQLLVEIHLMESKIHFGLRNLPKAKAALTASRTCANAIYVAPALQASIDSTSGVLHCEEGDYDTAHSYFLEAFEQLDQMNDRDKATPCLKYMMLCRILDSLTKALKLSAKGISTQKVGSKVGNSKNSDRSDVDISGMISGRQGVKYAGKDIEAMSAIAKAASKRSLKEFEAVTNTYKHELQDDLLIKHHLHILNEQLLESNLIRIVEPYSCVEISHISKLIEISQPIVEKKLSQMILDGKLHGILDQGKGQLVVYEESEKDLAMEKSLQVIANMDKVVTSLFDRSNALRTMMI